MGKTDLRVIKTEKILNETLLEILKEKSFEEVKVSDICDKALINRSTFYSHFTDKYDLLNSLIKNMKNNLIEELHKNKNVSNSKEYYIELISILLNHLEENQELYTNIMINNQYSIAINMVYNALTEDITKRIEENKPSDIPSRIISSFYIGAIFCTVIEWLRDKGKYTKEDIIKYLSKLINDNLK